MRIIIRAGDGPANFGTDPIYLSRAERKNAGSLNQSIRIMFRSINSVGNFLPGQGLQALQFNGLGQQPVYTRQFLQPLSNGDVIYDIRGHMYVIANLPGSQAPGSSGNQVGLPRQQIEPFSRSVTPPFDPSSGSETSAPSSPEPSPSLERRAFQPGYRYQSAQWSRENPVQSDPRGAALYQSRAGGTVFTRP